MTVSKGGWLLWFMNEALWLFVTSAIAYGAMHAVYVDLDLPLMVKIALTPLVVLFMPVGVRLPNGRRLGWSR